MVELKIPELGENIKSGNVVNILVSVGAQIKKDQDLVELETDKATLPIPSPYDGVIKEILIKVGDDVKVGQVIMKVDQGTAASPTAKAPKKEIKEEKTVSSPVKQVSIQSTPPPVIQPQPVRAVSSATSVLRTNEAIPSQKDVPAAPSVRRLARELGIVASQVPGGGPAGRISKDDVKAYAKLLITSGGRAATAGVAIQPLPDLSKWGEIERQPMSNIRKKTATHLSYCWQTIPHVTQFDKTDITELDKIRKKLSTETRKLTITPFLLKVMALALKKFPQFNASIDLSTHEIVFKKYIHLGVAVDTDRGLLVPVIRDVDKKNIFQLTDELNAMAERARTRKTALEELQGGCMTLTNLGGIGGTCFTPIVNWPEVAILGVSRASWEPRLENNQFVPRFMLPLSLSYDHRLIDGADGARFIRSLCEAIEKPSEMKWEG